MKSMHGWGIKFGVLVSLHLFSTKWVVLVSYNIVTWLLQSLVYFNGGFETYCHVLAICQYPATNCTVDIVHWSRVKLNTRLCPQVFTKCRFPIFAQAEGTVPRVNELLSTTNIVHNAKAGPILASLMNYKKNSTAH